MPSNELLRVEHLKKYFPIKTGLLKHKYVQAVEDVNLFINRGETLGLVGESGCGKTTLGRAILRLHEPTAGKIIYDGVDITHEKMLPYRRKMQIIFQDPSASLDPRMTVGEIVGEAIDIHRLADNKSDRTKRVQQLLIQVGLNSERIRSLFRNAIISRFWTPRNISKLARLSSKSSFTEGGISSTLSRSS